MKRILLILIFLILMYAVNGQVIDLQMLNQDPDPVRAGDIVEVRFKVENKWENTRYPVIVEIVPEYPFSLYSGSKEAILGILEADPLKKNIATASFKLLADNNARSGDNGIKVKLKIGETVRVYEDTFFIDVKSERIKLRPYIRSSDIVTGGSKGTISLEMANAGGYDIEFLELELLESDDYKLLSTSNYVYIGNLDSDDTESEEFEIYVSENVEKVKVPLRLGYEVNDYEYDEKHELILELLSKEEAEKIGLIRRNYTWIFVLGLVGLVIFYFIIRKIRK